MNLPDPEELIPTERVAVIVYLLCRGHRLRTMDAAVIAGIKRDSARVRLNAIARVLPMQEPCKENNFRWQLMDNEPED